MVGLGAFERVGDAGTDQIGKIGRPAAASQRLPVDEPACAAVRSKENIVDAQVAVDQRPRSGLAR